VRWVRWKCSELVRVSSARESKETEKIVQCQVCSKLPHLSRLHNTKSKRSARRQAHHSPSKQAQANMPLYAAEAPITSDLGGHLRFSPVLNRPSTSDSADDRIEFTSGLNVDEKVKKTDRERHAPLVFILDEEYMERVSYRAKVAAKCLMGVAFIVRLTFIYCICQIH